MKKEGVISFIRLVGRWLKGKFTSNFLFQKHFILEVGLESEPKTVYSPKTGLDNVVLRVVSHIGELTALQQEGYKPDTPFPQEILERRLKEGQIGFLVFIGKILAHSSWLITNAGSAAKAKIHPPLALDYGHSAYIWYCVTSPRFRGKALYPYTLSVINRYLQKGGIKKSVLAVEKDNEASLRGVEKAGFKIIGEDWYIKLWAYKGCRVKFYGKDSVSKCK